MRIVVLTPDADDAEADAVHAWAVGAGYEGTRAPLGTLCQEQLETAAVAWCHAGDAVPALGDAAAGVLRHWVARGGRLLLSLLATPLASAAGAPDEMPELETVGAWRDEDDPLWADGFRQWPGFPHVRGMQGWGQHPLFDGLVRGTFSWRATPGLRVPRAVFRRPRWPRGRVIAVERAYVRLDADTAVAWEYSVGSGRILCLGANVVLTMADESLASQRDRLLQNAIAYLDPARDDRGARHAWWPKTERTVGWADERTGGQRDAVGIALGIAPIAIAAGTGADAGADRGADRGADTGAATGAGTGAGTDGILPELVSVAPDDSPVTLGGRRALVVATERDGLREVWCHPLCAMSGGTTLRIDGAEPRAVEARITPADLVRTLQTVNGARWREHIVVASDRAVALHELTPQGVRRDVDLNEEVLLELDLPVRLEWPWPPDALAPLAVSRERDGTRFSVTVTGCDSRFLVALFVDGATRLDIISGPAGPQVRIASDARQGRLRLAFLGTTAGIAALASEARTLSDSGIPGTLARQRERLERLHASTPTLSTPAPDLDQAWSWATARLSNFLVQAPGLGCGLVAGYAATRAGWGESRPGYAWFFGRDACWTADALLAAGMFEEARRALEFLADTADVTGKIAHEVTTSGAAHYDAADSTPLFIRFACMYAEWTGDVATIRARWSAIRAAFAFVLSTDRDGDALPENAGVGHGWIEGGPLGGGSLTAYTAAIWIDALRRLDPLARSQGDDDLARRAADMLRRAQLAFETRLRDPASGRVMLHRRADGRAVTDLTALSAVPIALGVDTSTSAMDTLRALAESRYSAPWGVRLIATDDPRYDAEGYHAGAVWPLYTGWVALAEFACWRPDVATTHLLSNARCAFVRGKGAFDEVLHGDTGERAGICPDQAWSAAMVISPVVYGMLGLRPFAGERRCTLSPRWPSAWATASVRGLRIGDSIFSLRMERLGGVEPGERVHRHTLSLLDGPPLRVTFTGGSEPASGATEVALGAETSGAVRLERGTTVVADHRVVLPRNGS